MQNPQMQMAMTANGGPVNGTPVMANMSMPGPPQHQQMDPREQLNTYIYDYFLRNNHNRLARAMVECDMKMSTTPSQKTSPGNKSNGIDAMDDDSISGLPNPLLPKNQMADNSFLLDWWVQFWDIFQASKNRSGQPSKGAQYIQHTRHITQMQNEQRNQRMMMSNQMNAQYQNMGNMMRANMPNGVAQNDLKRAALQNNRPNGNPMAGVGQMNKPNMMGAQMQRDGSQMDMNGQRAPSPNSNENAPSPNKRPRVEGGMNTNMPNAQFNEFGQAANNAQQKNIEVYAQSLAQAHRVALNNTASPQAMTQGSPMNQGLEGQEIMFAGNQPRPGMPPQQPGQPQQQGSHALQDYQMQLMLLEQQNKKRLLMARQEQDNMSGPHQQGQGQFPPAMSPSGTRAGPSPNPADMKGRTPKLGQQGLPGSPMPEGMQQRASPAPNMAFPDPNLAPPGMPPQFYPQMPNNPMMRPPSSHPGANFNGQQQMTPQQMEAMRNGQMNGQWRGPPQPGMPQQPQMMGGPMAGGPQQRGQMPPPPAPANEQRPEASPAMSNQAPPTPNQANKAAPKKKGTKDNKKPAPKKGPNAGTTPAATAGEEAPTPTPSTPITPMHAKSFNPNGQPQAPQQPPQAQPPAQQQPPMGNDGPFGDLTEGSFDIGLGFGDGDTALENFDFDSFLHTGEDSGGFGSLVGFDDFTNGVEAGDGI
ncbi:SOM1 protein [Stagonosporopsis vannaccii]|nr:SOM1 protein [Stagonosporopsis vannaccii]